MRIPLSVAFACAVGCAQSEPPVPLGPPQPPPVVSSSPAASAAPPAIVDAEPTSLTPEQKQRDAARASLAASIVDAYPNSGGMFTTLVAEWSPDGRRVLYGSMRDGLPEIYEGDVAKIADAPRAVTSGPERALSASYTPDGKSILFLRDAKGNEQFHIWRVGVDGSGLVDLTPSDGMRRSAPRVPRGKPDLMLFSATRMTSTEAMLYTKHLDASEPKLVYTHKRPGFLVDVTPDGARALFVDLAGLDDNAVLEIDVASGAAHRVYPPEGKTASVYRAVYSSDGRRVLVGTDEGGDASALLALDAKTSRELARYAPTPRTAAVRPIVSPRGDHVVADLDCGDHSEARILDPTTLKHVRDVKVPLGDISVGAFRGDGKAFSLLVSLPDHPPDVYSGDVATGEIRPLRDDKRPGLDQLPAISYEIERVTADDGLTIPINRYVPRGAKKTLPTIAIFHGGPATSYAVRWSTYARFFLSINYAVLEPNVRGSSGFGRAFVTADDREKRADWLKDVALVNAWTKKQPWADPERVVVWGQSYGGYTTLMALTRQPTLWRAGVDLYGPSDWRAFMGRTEGLIRFLLSKEFGDPEKDGELLDRFSPLHDADKIVAPLFVYSGQNDPRVPRAESDAIVVALRKRGVPVEYMVAANEGHTVERRETKIELLTRTARFLEDALR
jgi:dipeptidyl aminopeptidase/acylaminoacyl peptidase